ncbi:MAG: PAS domain-containing protein [Oscillatoria sp. PMC 1068.18]|nr:PAS domain-containing protein [Oscillatoria sp. PMC 1076.18]MEC4987347.1 PAS domain-containing protein [Oscillatoria sp. PMC 1068.18]
MKSQGFANLHQQQVFFNHNHGLSELITLPGLQNGDLAQVCTRATEIVAAILEVERVGIWFYDRDKTLIRCFDLYESNFARHAQGMELSAAAYPLYFQALATEQAIVAEDAQNHPSTKEFSQDYFQPQKVVSTLDAPIIHQGELVGVVCTEKLEVPKQWRSHDLNLVISVALVVSLCLETQSRISTLTQLQNSQQMLQLVIDNIPQAIFWKDQNSVYQGCNQSFAHDTGLESVAEIVGKTDYDLPWTKAKADFFRECDRRTIATNIAEYNIIEPQLQADGKQAWLETNKIPLTDNQGEVIGILATYEDITKRKQAEENLEKVNQKLEQRVAERTKELSRINQFLELVINNIPQSIFWKDENSVYLGCNRSFALDAGLVSPTEIIGKTDYDLPWSKTETEFYRKCDRQVMETNTARYHIIESQVQADGQQVWVDTNKMPLHNEQGKVIGILGSYENITKRQQAQIDLQKSQTKLKIKAQQEQLLNQLSHQIRQSLNLDEILTTAVAEIYSQLDVDRCNFSWFHPGNPSLWEVVKEACKPELPSLIGEYSHEENSLLERLLQLEVIQENDLANCSEPSLHSLYQEQGCRSLILLPIKTIEEDLGVLSFGNYLTQRNWTESEIELMLAVRDQLAIAIKQAELYNRAKERAVQLEKALAELNRKKLQLVQAEKMSSLGQMVAGLAHEINNPVSFIHGNLTHLSGYTQDLLDLLALYEQKNPHPDTEIAAKIEEVDLEFLREDLVNIVNSIQVGTDRICEIVRSLRTFSRLDEAELKSADIHEGLSSTLLILQHRLKASGSRPQIEVIKEYGNLPLVDCYPGALNQVFMNLLANAIEAIEESFSNSESSGNKYQGKIVIQTTVINQEVVKITITDNGSGISNEAISQLFDPFFTTKPIGKGTGLGLSISHSIIVDRHGGSLTCNSQLDVGTEFIVEIPLRHPECT